jgi:extracellular elastinolytic metalloproteinase
VVFHEFVHGVTNRLVGGPLNTNALEAHQSRGMGEGWGDYIACTINDTTVVGAWVVNRAGGIRKFPYDTNFPDHFGKLGTGRYTGFLPDGRRHPHPIGEIWCAALMEMNRNIGAELGVQLVVDALKLAPTNPSFLEMRDSILAALEDMLDEGKLSQSQHSAAQDGI